MACVGVLPVSRSNVEEIFQTLKLLENLDLFSLILFHLPRKADGISHLHHSVIRIPQDTHQLKHRKFNIHSLNIVDTFL